jgi:predicted nucleotidyltransferase
MDVGRPFEDLLPGARGLVLLTLVQLESPVTVRALGRHAGVSAQQALRIVNDLAETGIVGTERVGQSLLVRLNRSHLLVEPLLALTATRSRLVERLRAELGGWSQLAGAWLFGSTARGDGNRSSDIDLLLVASRSIDSERWGRDAARLINDVASWTGNTVQLVEHTRSSFAVLVENRNPLVDAIRHEGIPLTDRSRQLLRTAA